MDDKEKTRVDGHDDKPWEEPGRPSWFRKVVVLLVLVAMVIIARHFVAKVWFAKSEKQVVTDPCAACKPDSKTIMVGAVTDDGRIKWDWTGPCVGPGMCDQCRVQTGSCTTENDTTLADECTCRKK